MEPGNDSAPADPSIILGAWGPAQDRWLQPWLPLLQEAASPAVLELGCDTGGDTAWLCRQGLKVVAGDIALPALRACAQSAPEAHLLQLDLRQPLPFRDRAFGAVMASLCLHYFDWATTVRAVAEVRRCLRPDGLLLVRLNATTDVLHGAAGHEEIEPNFYRVNGRYAETKRFFDEADLDRLFAVDWATVSRRSVRIHRYEAPKIAWELILRRA